MTVATLTGDNGLLQKASNAKEETQNATDFEKLRLAVISSIDERGVDTKTLTTNLSKIENLTDLEGNNITTDEEVVLPKIVKINNNSYILREDGNVVKNDLNAYNQDGLLLHLDGINNTRNGRNTNATIWEDLSGNNNDFRLNNFNNTNTSGWQEDSIKFDGENDFLQSINSFNFDNSKELSIQFVDLDGTLYNNTSISMILESSNDINSYSNSNSFAVNVNEFDDKTLALDFRTSQYNNYNSLNEIEKLSENKSVHFTITFNAENEHNDYVRIYKNSILSPLVHNNDVHTASLSNYIFKTYPIYIGSRGGNSLFTKMKLASVRIYNRVLTEEEIKNNYEIDKARFNF